MTLRAKLQAVAAVTVGSLLFSGSGQAEEFASLSTNPAIVEAALKDYLSASGDYQPVVKMDYRPIAKDGTAMFLVSPDEERIVDSVLSSDMNTIKEMYSRLETLDASGLDNADYHMTKARNWIDFAYDEYTDNDRSDVTDGALAEALWLITEMEQGNRDITLDTPIIVTSRLVRQDLWNIAQFLKTHQGYSCIAPILAELEVQLVWAGHEYNELGWRHAVPNIDKAERLAREALKGANACNATPFSQPISDPIVAPTLECPSCQQAAKIMPRRVYFGRDQDWLAGDARDVVYQLIAVMRVAPQLRVKLEGHTDKRMSIAYNQDLARRRIESVRSVLVSKGIDANRIETEVMGESDPLKEGCTSSVHAYNRRVEFVPLDSSGEIIQEDYDSSLQPDSSQPDDCADPDAL